MVTKVLQFGYKKLQIITKWKHAPFAGGHDREWGAENQFSKMNFYKAVYTRELGLRISQAQPTKEKRRKRGVKN